MGRNKTEFNPDWATPPGATLQDMLAELGVSQSALAREMGRPLKTINEIIRGKARITSETAIGLELAGFGTAGFWVKREAIYRLRLARLVKRKGKR